MAAAKVSQVQARHNARVKALQALYQWDLSDTNLIDIEKQFAETQEMKRVDSAYFSELLHEIPKRLDVLDGALAECLDRNIDELDPIERVICRLGAYEMTERLDIPFRVVINEYVDITKKFSGENGHRYVNAVMDKLAQRCRAPELAAVNKSR